MADPAHTTTAITALLRASIASVCFALQKTRTVLARHGVAPTDADPCAPRPDPFDEVFRRVEPRTSAPAPLPPIGVALSRRREVLGSYDGETNNG